jgi:y4mF family transcriptional regulator
MLIPDAKTFGQLIRNIRKRDKLTQHDLAAACGVGVRFISELERGKSGCQLEKSLQVAKMLGLILEIKVLEVKGL